MSETNDGHGAVGKNEQPFTKLKELRSVGYDAHKLAILAKAMSLVSGDQADDGADAEENLYVPAGYTYLGQFVDHDLTFDTTSSLDPLSTDEPTNRRSPRFDLDCLYGGGPDDQPFMYDADHATLLYGGQGPDTPLDRPYDLLRSRNGRAIIGDKRNDENSIVNQIQYSFIQFHNHVVEELKVSQGLSGKALFVAARNEVRWAYQRILVDDFLPRIISPDVLGPFVAQWKQDPSKAYLWYTPEKRGNLPREFVAAAYRFGHSGVRTGYRLSGKPGPDMKNERGFRASIFDGSDDSDNSLIGFEPLLANHVVDDWARFFPLAPVVPGKGPSSNTDPNTKYEDGGDGTVRLQYAYKLDTTLVDPLAALPSNIADPGDVPGVVGAEYAPPKDPKPSLALLNLLRGSKYQIQGGQSFASDLPMELRLPTDYLRVRATAPNGFKFTHIRDLKDSAGKKIDEEFNSDTPLWFYILAEAQRPIVQLWLDGNQADLTEEDLKGLDSAGKPLGGDKPARASGTQLGPVGGRMVAEVFYGLLDADNESVFRVQPLPGAWTPIWGDGPATMARLLQYAHRPISDLSKA